MHPTSQQAVLLIQVDIAPGEYIDYHTELCGLSRPEVKSHLIRLRDLELLTITDDDRVFATEAGQMFAKTGMLTFRLVVKQVYRVERNMICNVTAHDVAHAIEIVKDTDVPPDDDSHWEYHWEYQETSVDHPLDHSVTDKN